MPIINTGTTRWDLDARGFIRLIGTKGAFAFPIIGAERPRIWPLKPIRYSPRFLHACGHKLAWREGDRQRIRLLHPWGRDVIPWNFPHWME